MNSDSSATMPRPLEQAEPAAERAPAPIWLIVLLGVLLYVGLVELDKNGGGFNVQVYQPYASFAVLDAAQPVVAGGDLKRGKIIFNNSCSACHQPSGLGLPGQYPPLAGSEWVLAPSPERVIRIVLNGLGGPVDVKSLHFGGAIQMPAWKTTIPKDEDLAAVISFIRGNKDWGNNASPVSVEEIKADRDLLKTRSDSQFFTVEELMKIPDKK